MGHITLKRETIESCALYEQLVLKQDAFKLEDQMQDSASCLEFSQVDSLQKVP